MLIKLAWRNIWRNKRRTFITATSIMFAVMFASTLESLQEGAWDHMLSNVVNFYFGYAQVHKEGYWDEQSIDKAISLEKAYADIGEDIKGVEVIVPRLESFALASYKNNSTGVLVVGTDPEKEEEMTGLRERLIEGTYFDEKDRGVLVASGLAENLGVKTNDTLVLISQGYHGVNAAGKYPIRGLVEFASPELNKQMVYLPLPEAQWFYGADGMVTSMAFSLNDRSDLKNVMKTLRNRLDGETYEVMDWKAMLPDLVKAKELDNVGNYVVYLILYTIIAFGIFGTILMMTKERAYEFGVLVSIGMHRIALSVSVWMEVIMMGMMGALAGILLSIPVVWYFYENPIRFTGQYAETFEKFSFEPILPATFNVVLFAEQALIVFIVTALLAIYPFYTIGRMDPVQSMRA